MLAVTARGKTKMDDIIETLNKRIIDKETDNFFISTNNMKKKKRERWEDAKVYYNTLK